MKAGPCREVFVVRVPSSFSLAFGALRPRTHVDLTHTSLSAVVQAWEKCVDKHREAGDDFVEACVPFTHGLKECMEANSEYYGALLVRGSLELQGAKGDSTLTLKRWFCVAG